MAMNADTLTLPDSVLVTRILAGEKQLFEVFVKKYNKRLYRISMAILHDEDDAEDMMQAAYVKAYENLHRFEGRADFSTWLTRIAINEGLMRLKKRNKNVPIDKTISDLQIENRHPMSAVINTELKEILEKAVAELPTKYRVVFMLREVEGMNVEETTSCLEISEANVKVRLNRAKEMLRESLTNYVQTEELYAFHLTRCDRVKNKVMEMILKSHATTTLKF
jgi:RNA polymerase sigma factor (sigma-70 family)